MSLNEPIDVDTVAVETLRSELRKIRLLPVCGLSLSVLVSADAGAANHVPRVPSFPWLAEHPAWDGVPEGWEECGQSDPIGTFLLDESGHGFTLLRTENLPMYDQETGTCLEARMGSLIPDCLPRIAPEGGISDPMRYGVPPWDDATNLGMAYLPRGLDWWKNVLSPHA